MPEKLASVLEINGAMPQENGETKMTMSGAKAGWREGLPSIDLR